MHWFTTSGLVMLNLVAENPLDFGIQLEILNLRKYQFFYPNEQYHQFERLCLFCRYNFFCIFAKTNFEEQQLWFTGFSFFNKITRKFSSIYNIYEPDLSIDRIQIGRNFRYFRTKINAVIFINGPRINNIAGLIHIWFESSSNQIIIPFSNSSVYDDVERFIWTLLLYLYYYYQI